MGSRNSAEFQKPQPLLVSKKVRRYTSNLYGSTPPICIAGPSWLLNLEERETQQYTSHLYGSTFEKVLGVGVTGKFLISVLLIRIGRGPPTICGHHKDFGSKKGFERGWCTNCRNLREQQYVYHPQDCTGDVHNSGTKKRGF